MDRVRIEIQSQRSKVVETIKKTLKKVIIFLVDTVYYYYYDLIVDVETCVRVFYCLKLFCLFNLHFTTFKLKSRMMRRP